MANKQIINFELLNNINPNIDNILVQRDNGTTFRIHISSLPQNGDYSTAGNGLMSNGNSIELGGDITKETTINVSDYGLFINGYDGGKIISIFGDDFSIYDNNGTNSKILLSGRSLWNIDNEVVYDWNNNKFYKNLDLGDNIIENVALLRFYGSYVSIEENLIQDPNATSINWGSRDLCNDVGNTVLNWNIQTAYDLQGGDSIYWNERKLLDSVGNYSIDYNNRVMTYSNGSWSINFNDGLMFDYNETLSIDYNNKILSGTDGEVYDWGNNRFLKDIDINDNYINNTWIINGYGKSMSFEEGILFDTNNNASISWESRELYDDSNRVSFSWSNRTLLDSSNTDSILFDERYLADGSGTPSVLWSSRELLTDEQDVTYDWQNNKMYFKGYDDFSNIPYHYTVVNSNESKTTYTIYSRFSENDYDAIDSSTINCSISLESVGVFIGMGKEADVDGSRIQITENFFSYGNGIHDTNFGFMSDTSGFVVNQDIVLGSNRIVTSNNIVFDRGFFRNNNITALDVNNRALVNVNGWTLATWKNNYFGVVKKNLNEDTAFLNVDNLTNDRTFTFPDENGEFVINNIGTTAKTPTSVGKKRELSYNGGFLYICIDTNVWTRVAVQTTW